MSRVGGAPWVRSDPGELGWANQSSGLIPTSHKRCDCRIVDRRTIPTLREATSGVLGRGSSSGKQLQSRRVEMDEETNK